MKIGQSNFKDIQGMKEKSLQKKEPAGYSDGVSLGSNADNLGEQLKTLQDMKSGGSSKAKDLAIGAGILTGLIGSVVAGCKIGGIPGAIIGVGGVFFTATLGKYVLPE